MFARNHLKVKLLAQSCSDLQYKGIAAIGHLCAGKHINRNVSDGMDLDSYR
jgi:hypothetical protein